MTIYESGLLGQPTIVFLHGLGVSSWMWQEQIDALEQAYHCLAIDMPGNGASCDLPWQTVAATASQIAAAIQKRATNGQAHIVGLSLGGYVALELLRIDPDCVLSMVVSGVSTKPLMRSALVKPVSAMAARLLRFKPLVKLSAKAMQLPEEAVALYQQDFKRLTPETIKRIYNEVLRYHRPTFEREAASKLLVAVGDKEAKAVKAGLDDFSAETTTVIAPNAHHGWNGEHPDLFTDMIRAWISNAPLPSGLQIQQQSTARRVEIDTMLP